jgi:hypothetical protein
MDLLILSIYGLSYWLASIPNITFHTEKRRAIFSMKSIEKSTIKGSGKNMLNAIKKILKKKG